MAVEQQDSLLKIRAFCWSSQEGTLQYRLEARKAGESGRSISSQSGSAHVQGGEEKLLSQLFLRVTLQDRYSIQLIVYREGKKVGEDSVTYPPGKGEVTVLPSGTLHYQDRRTLNLASPQAFQGLICRGQWKNLDFRSNQGLRGDLQEL